MMSSALMEIRRMPGILLVFFYSFLISAGIFILITFLTKTSMTLLVASRRYDS